MLLAVDDAADQTAGGLMLSAGSQEKPITGGGRGLTLLSTASHNAVYEYRTQPVAKKQLLVCSCAKKR